MASAAQVQQVTPEEEFKKNPDLKAGDLELLRGWLETQKHLPAISDNMLIQFHHSCYYDLALTKVTIENYYTMRSNTPEFFTQRDMRNPALTEAEEVVCIAPLPVLDPLGYRINYFGLRDYEPSRFILADAVKLVFMTIEQNGLKFGTVPGYHAIFDMKGAKLKHLTRLSASVLKSYVLFGENALPVRRKSIFLVNVAPWLDTLINMTKHWLSKDTLKHLHFHSGDMESLYELIPRECLPKELGGVLESVQVYHAANCRDLEGLCEYFIEDEKLRVDESKRGETAAVRDIAKGEGTFKQLDLD